MKNEGFMVGSYLGQNMDGRTAAFGGIVWDCDMQSIDGFILRCHVCLGPEILMGRTMDLEDKKLLG